MTSELLPTPVVDPRNLEIYGNTPAAKYLSRRDLSLVEKGYKDSYPCRRYGR